MKLYAFITGRNQALSLEELIVTLEPLGQIIEEDPFFLLFRGDIDPSALIDRLGGTIKVIEIISSVDRISDITKDTLIKCFRSELSNDAGRFDFGISAYGVDQGGKQQLRKTGLELKRHVKSLKRPSRFVFNTDGILSSVAVRKNKLINREVVILSGDRLHIGMTRAVQDFDSYSLRDFGRPSRNAERGMLPPKLAQIMLNLARVDKESVLLDPFCGSGTVVQEALVRGVRSVWGSDKDASAIDEAKKNTQWLSEHFSIAKPHLAVADVFALTKEYGENQFSAVTTEMYLGPARLLKQKSLTRSAFSNIQGELNRLYMHFFEELSEVVASGSYATIAFPVFNLFGEEFLAGHFEQYERYGWKLQKPAIREKLPELVYSSRGNLLYRREKQIVQREITVWKRT